MILPDAIASAIVIRRTPARPCAMPSKSARDVPGSCCFYLRRFATMHNDTGRNDRVRRPYARIMRHAARETRARRDREIPETAKGRR
jgi:hypothetical protein